MNKRNYMRLSIPLLTPHPSLFTPFSLSCLLNVCALACLCAHRDNIVCPCPCVYLCLGMHVSLFVRRYVYTHLLTDTHNWRAVRMQVWKPVCACLQAAGVWEGGCARARVLACVCVCMCDMRAHLRASLHVCMQIFTIENNMYNIHIYVYIYGLSIWVHVYMYIRMNVWMHSEK